MHASRTQKGSWARFAAQIFIILCSLVWLAQADNKKPASPPPKAAPAESCTIQARGNPSRSREQTDNVQACCQQADNVQADDNNVQACREQANNVQADDHN